MKNEGEGQPMARRGEGVREREIIYVQWVPKRQGGEHSTELLDKLLRSMN